MKQLDKNIRGQLSFHDLYPPFPSLKMYVHAEGEQYRNINHIAKGMWKASPNYLFLAFSYVCFLSLHCFYCLTWPEGKCGPSFIPTRGMARTLHYVWIVSFWNVLKKKKERKKLASWVKWWSRDVSELICLYSFLLEIVREILSMNIISLTVSTRPGSANRKQPHMARCVHHCVTLQTQPAQEVQHRTSDGIKAPSRKIPLFLFLCVRKCKTNILTLDCKFSVVQLFA